jgi:hypothetical protein
MRKTFAAAVAAIALALVPAALAGECGASGFDCANECPLAQKANTMRSSGTESFAARGGLADLVQKNLARI